MAISNRIREAYETGQKAAEETRNPLYLITPSIYERPDDSEEAEAWDKGFNGEQLDEDDE